MIAFEKVFKEEKPDWVVALGDVNATIACSITAKKEHIKVAHIEAQLEKICIEILEHPENLREKSLQAFDRIEKIHNPLVYGETLLKYYRECL